MRAIRAYAIFWTLITFFLLTHIISSIWKLRVFTTKLVVYNDQNITCKKVKYWLSSLSIMLHTTRRWIEFFVTYQWYHCTFFVFSNILNSVLESDIFYAIYVSGLTFIYFFYSLYFIHYFHSIVTHYIWDLYISAYNIHANIDLCMIIHYVVKGFFCKWERKRTKHIEWNKMHINTNKKKQKKKI